MNPVVDQWVRKADGDYLTATREMSADPPNHDAVCYHAQQCVEKLLKALLMVQSVVPPRTHDLNTLDAAVRVAVADWAWPEDELRLLTRAATVFRYPGEEAGEPEADAALHICARARARLLILIQAR
jgi:HEPN domain-containing protein